MDPGILISQKNDFKIHFTSKNQAIMTLRLQMQLVVESLSDVDYLSALLIHHCMSLLPGMLNKELF